MEDQKTVLKLKSGQMLNPIFPVRGLYTHSTFAPNPDPSEPDIETLHFESITKDLGDETTIQILGEKSQFEKNPFLAHSLQVGNYRVYQSELIESKPAHKGYLGGGSSYTHLNTIKVKLIGWGSAEGKTRGISLTALLTGYSELFPGYRALLTD